MKSHKAVCLLCLYFLTICCSLLSTETYERQTMIVQGHAVLRKPADELQLTLGVISQGKSAEEALRINNQKTQKIVQELQQFGLSQSEYQTSRFNIHPIYSVPPKDPPPDWRAVVSGYEVTNQITVLTSKLELAGPIIDKTSQAGANTIDQLSFNLRNRRVYQSESLTLATQYALEDAQQLAQAAHVQLLRILNISLNQSNPYPQPRMAYAMKSVALNEMNTSISPGDVEISSDVTITYEIH